jgi:Meiotically Up-regulated Gene 113 (MUG113) protein
MGAEAEAATERPGSVYVIGSLESRLVKIGRTTNLGSRLGVLQRMSPVPLHVRWRTEGGCELETALHQRFKAQRVHGEWFDFGEADPVAEVKSAAEAIERSGALVRTPKSPRSRALAAISTLPPADQARVAAAMIPDLRRIRRDALTELKADHSFAEIGAMVGLSGARVDQIIRGE